MNRKRRSHRSLPHRVYPHHGAYIYKPAQPIRINGELKGSVKLCRIEDGEAEMHKALSIILGDKSLLTDTMPHLCSEYKANKLNRYTKQTKDEYGRFLDIIADDFEDFHVAQVTTKNCAEFLRNHYKDKNNTARKVAALMKRVFKYGISELGLRQDNPMDQIDVSDYETKRRTILPTHAQVAAIREAGMYSKPRSDTGKSLPNPSGPMFQCLVDMAYLCWQRAIDVRTIKESQITKTHIRFAPTKTDKTSGKAVDIEITPAIQNVIDRAREIKKGYHVISPYLFPTMKGTAYKKGGLFSMWDRARDRLGIGKDSPPEERVQFRDLRALGATDAAKAGASKKDIQNRLVHTTQKTSEIYIKDVVPETSNLDVKLPW